MDWSALGFVAFVYALGLISPGPNTIAVVHRAVTTTRLEALALVAGVVLVNSGWAAAAILGMAAVFELFPWAFWTIKAAGGGYLIWLGFKLITGGPAAAPAPRSARPRGLARAFGVGVMTNLANAKSMVFFGSIFSTAVPPDPSPVLIAAMLAIVLTLATLWYGLVAVALSAEPLAAVYAGARRWIERICGALLIVIGARLVFSR